MNCENFLENIEDAENREDLKEHLKTCESCRKEYELHLLLKKGISELESFPPSPSLWARIEKDFKKETAVRKKFSFEWLKKIKDFIFEPDYIYRPVIAAAVLIIMLISGVYYLKPTSIAEKNRIQTQTISELAKAQEHYINAIESLNKLAMDNQKNIESGLFAMYREKLQFIDESIRECKNIIEQNELNVNAWNFLFASYQKKVDTLQEIANYKKDEDKTL